MSKQTSKYDRPSTGVSIKTRTKFVSIAGHSTAARAAREETIAAADKFLLARGIVTKARVGSFFI